MLLFEKFLGKNLIYFINISQIFLSIICKLFELIEFPLWSSYMFSSGPNLDEDEDDKKDNGTTNGHEKPKTPQQRAGETLLRHILENADGESYSFRFVNILITHLINVYLWITAYQQILHVVGLFCW